MIIADRERGAEKCRATAVEPVLNKEMRFLPFRILVFRVKRNSSQIFSLD